MDINTTLENQYEEAKRIIQQAKRDKRLVVFVGAGVSVNYGIPSWGSAIQKIAYRLGIHHFSDNDMLKIPQYYYNQRGKKEYTDLMRRIFKYNKKLRAVSPSLKIMDKIWDLEADTIITTNYDNLIKNIANKRHEPLQIISSDKDFPYNSVGKKLIKMHGDFDHDNFVLKEDDYLHYFKNFKLIENYIKSVIGNNVILFLGYSFNDPDIKQIFTWVKDVLKNDFQRAYLVNVTDGYDKNIEDYYRRLGVNIIFAKSWLKRENKSDPGAILSAVLDKINHIKTASLEAIYTTLKPFKNFNYIHSNYLQKAFRPWHIAWNCALKSCSKKYILSFQARDSDAEKIIEQIFTSKQKLSNDNQKRVYEIRKLFKKSNYRGVNLISIYKNEEPNIVKIKRVNVPSWAKLIFDFNYKKLRKLRNKNDEILQNNDQPELCMIQATISYYLEDYRSCYSYLLQAENTFYDLEMYSSYFIALFNRKIIAGILGYNYAFSESLRSSMIKNYKSIDLEETLNNIPILDNDSNHFLTDLSKSTLILDLFFNIYNETQQVTKEAKSSYIAFAGSAAYKKLRSDMQDIYRYELYNNILVDYQFIRLTNMYSRSIISSIETKDPQKNNVNNSLLQGKNISAKNLHKIDINLLLQFSGNVEDLKRIFRGYSFASIPLDYGTLQYLKTVLINLIYEISNNRSNQITDRFWAAFYLLQFLKLDSNLVKLILQNLPNQINERELALYKDYICNFIGISIEHGLLTKDDHNYIESILEKSLKIVSNLSYDMDFESLIVYLASKLKSFGRPYNNIQTVKALLNKRKLSLLVGLYRFCSKDIQKIIKGSNLIQHFSDDEKDYLRYLTEVRDNITVSSKKYEAMIINYLQKNSKTQKYVFPDLRVEIISKFLNNYFMDHKNIVDFPRLKKAVLSSNVDGFYKWLIDYINFDYKNNFNVDWLKRCGQNVIQKIFSHKKIRKDIRKNLNEAFVKGNNDRQLIKIYFQYFFK